MLDIILSESRWVWIGALFDNALYIKKSGYDKNIKIYRPVSLLPNFGDCSITNDSFFVKEMR